MLWMFGLQLFISGFFESWPTVLVGIVPVLATVAFVGWTIYKVMEEMQIMLVQDSSAVTKGPSKTTDMVLQSPNGDSCTMAIQEFNTLYEPTEQHLSDSLFEQGFRAYRPTTRVWAQRLTADDIAADFPNGRFVSSSGAPVSVQSGQYIALSFPQGDDVSVVDAQQFEDDYVANTEETSDGRVVSQAEVLQVWDDMLRREGSTHAKCTKVHAKRMTEEGTIATVIDGKIEARRRAYEKGDYVVCGSRGGRYPMKERQFLSRYSTTHPDPASDPALARAGFKLFKAKGKVGLRSS